MSCKMCKFGPIWALRRLKVHEVEETSKKINSPILNKNLNKFKIRPKIIQLIDKPSQKNSQNSRKVEN